MNIQTMRIIDHYAGNTLCYLLSIYERIIRPFIKKDTGSIREILVMKCFGIGSILLSVPMFRALRKSFPTAKIIFLSFYNNAEICQRLQFADKYLYLRKGNLRIFITDLIKVLFELRRYKFDIAIDMEFFPNLPPSLHI